MNVDQNMIPNRNTKSISVFQTKKIVDRSMAESHAWINSSTYYHSDYLLNVLMQAALDKTSVEDICQTNGPYPSPDTVLKMLADTHCDKNRTEIEESVAQLMQNPVKNHIMFKRPKKPKVITSIDLHPELYFGKHLYDDDKRLSMFSQRDHRYTLWYATITIISGEDEKWRYPLTIGFVLNHLGQPRLDVVKRLLGQINIPLKIDLLLMDGGFNVAEIFEYLDAKNINFLVRGRYSSKKQYPPGNIFLYETGKAKYSVRAYMLPARDKNGKRTLVMLLGSKNQYSSLKKVKILYKKRFRIENTYRQARIVKIRTSTSNIKLRWIMWAFAHFVELIWQLVRYVHQVLKVDAYACRQKQFIRVLREEMQRSSLLELIR